MNELKMTEKMRGIKLDPNLVATLIIGGVSLVAIPPCLAESVWVSSLNLDAVTQGWGTPRADKSVDGNPLSISGQKFEKGIGTHALSSFRLNLKKGAARFQAFAGVDDETNQRGSVEFQVMGDGKVLWKSGVMKGGQVAKPVDLNVTGVSTLLLLITDGGDGDNFDHANWADARLEVTGARPEAIQSVRQILTPTPGPAPRINGPKVFGVRPGSSFLYSIPATGNRPMTFSVDKLPEGLKLDAATGRITGALAKAGEYSVILRAKNKIGEAEKKFRIVVGEEIALTPPLGWNSWNAWRDSIDDQKILRSARAMVKFGLDQHGWTYINMDDGWQGKRGGPFNAIQPDLQRFPDMKALCDEIHGMGLKVGIYSTPWTTSYASRVGGTSENPEGFWDAATMTAGVENKKILPYAVGKYSFATNDAKQWAAWGIDYLKYDWRPNEVPETREMYNALRASGRDVVFSLSNSAPFGAIVELSKYANSWRIGDDIFDNWNSVQEHGFGNDRWAPYSRPGHWNDPDMFEIGAHGGGSPKRLTADEQYTHVSQWCLLAAPLLLGNDMEHLDDFTVGLLTNDEVLEVNQDVLGKQATLVANTSELDVYAKPLEDGSRAVGLFNRSHFDAKVAVKWSDLKIKGKHVVRDLWRQKDIGVFQDRFEASVAPHGVVLVRIAPRKK